MLDVSCPHCGSENTQSIPVLMASGMSHGTIAGGGISYSGGGGLGGHTFSGGTTNISVLARRFMMPPAPTSKGGVLVTAVLLAFFGFFFLVIGLATAQEGSGGCGVFLGLVALPFFLVYFSDKKTLPFRRAQWAERRAYLDRAWFCHRCGADWDPSQVTAPTGAQQ